MLCDVNLNYRIYNLSFIVTLHGYFDKFAADLIKHGEKYLVLNLELTMMCISTANYISIA